MTGRWSKSAETTPVLVDGEGDRRDLRLDACRGLALWIIFLNHIPDNALTWLTQRNYGFSDSTEIFVFVSGYTCMLAYGGALRSHGWRETIARALRRGLEIYAAFLLLLVAYCVLVWVVGAEARYFDESNTAVFFGNPGTALARAVMLQYAPVDTDILPTFALLHLSFPLLLWLMTRSATLALAASLLLYLMVQLYSWHVPAWPRGEMYFNPFAWQVLFVFGAWYATAGGGWPLLKRMLQSRPAVLLAALFLLASLEVTLSWQFKALDILPEALSKAIYPIDKSHLAPLRLLHFLALAIVVVHLAPHDWRGLRTPLATATIRCGENSLAVYCLGVLLSFAGHVILTKISDALVMQIAVSLAGIVIMIAAANLMTWESKLDRRGPKLF